MMQESHVIYLRCPRCYAELNIGSVAVGQNGRIQEGTVVCSACRETYPVVRSIPRFVSNANYAAGFGLEWTKHARTQYDSYTRLPISQRRFFQETHWPAEMPGQLILEAGSGSGRFTEIAASTGAMVVSFDYSFAVEANYASNGHCNNVLIVQGDIFSPPVPPGSFDKLFCFGVLQHTPDPHRAFLSLPRFLKPGGDLSADVYLRSFFATILHTKYLLRVITRRVEPERLYRFTQRWVDLMWPVAKLIRRIPKIGVSINWRLLVADYSNFELPESLLKEWAYLDTFDMLGPRYDRPQSLSTFRRWFEQAGLTDVDVHLGHNGVEGRGRRPGVPEAN